MHRRVLLGVTGMAMLALTATPAFASSHREAPLIKDDPAADLTDVYAWRDARNSSKLNLLMSAVPLQEPGDAPNYYDFGETVRYDMNVDNDGDARADLTWRFTFDRQIRNPDTFLYNTGAITSLADRDWNIRQTYTVRKITWRDNGRVAGSTVLGRNIPIVPNNIGPTSTPNYARLVAQGVRMVGPAKHTTVWAGQTDDPFFLDLAAIGDLVNVRPAGRAPDTLGGFNVQSIAMQVFIDKVAKKGHPTIGVWADTERQNIDVLTGGGIGAYRQVERLGNPLVNEVIIPLRYKDRWNHRLPAGDRFFDRYFLNPGLAAVLGAPAENRKDILAVFHTGVPGLNATGGPHADMLRLNTSIKPTARPNPLGVLGGDLAGFPNGRRLTDDTVDIELQALVGELIGNPNDVSDGVNENDVRFLSRFPYLALSHSGFQHRHHLPPE
jgi:hypothetical protein